MHSGNQNNIYFVFLLQSSLVFKAQLLPVRNDSHHNYYQVNTVRSEEEVNKNKEPPGSSRGVTEK